MTPQEKQQFDKMYQDIQSIKNSASIPYEIDSAFRERFNIASFTPLTGSAKNATSENKAVNESGAGSYSVMDKPDGFLQVTIGVTTYYLPYFS